MKHEEVIKNLKYKKEDKERWINDMEKNIETLEISLAKSKSELVEILDAIACLEDDQKGD